MQWGTRQKRSSSLRYRPNQTLTKGREFCWGRQVVSSIRFHSRIVVLADPLSPLFALIPLTCRSICSGCCAGATEPATAWTLLQTDLNSARPPSVQSITLRCHVVQTPFARLGQVPPEL